MEPDERTFLVIFRHFFAMKFVIVVAVAGAVVYAFQGRAQHSSLGSNSNCEGQNSKGVCEGEMRERN